MRTTIRPDRTAALACLLTACSGGGGGGDSVAATLQALGVSTELTPPLDDQGQPMLDHAPLGTVHTLERKSELVVAGVPRVGDPSGALLNLLEDLAGGELGVQAPLAQTSTAAQPWMAVTQPLGAPGSAPQTRRAFAAADIDGNGREDVVAVHADGAGLHLFTLRDVDGAYAQSDVLHEPGFEADELALAAGDLDGNGVDELVVCSAGDAGVRLAVYSFAAGGPVLDFWVLYPNDLAGSQATVNVVCGNLDSDRFEEIALTINETDGLTQLCRYRVQDDAQHAFTTLTSAYLTGANELVTSDVALGDVDGDGIDELLVGGLESFDDCGWAHYRLFAFDDASRGFEPLADRDEQYSYHSCFGVVNVRFAHVVAGDIDGDGVDEVSIGHYVYDDLLSADPLEVRWQLHPSVVVEDDDSKDQVLDRSTSAVVAADVTGNGRANLAFLRKNWGLRVYGLEDAVSVTPLPQVDSLDFDSSDYDQRDEPVLLAPDADADGIVLHFEAERSGQVFSAPIVLAALAAPPYHSGIGQDVAVTSTAWGVPKTPGDPSSFALQVTVGPHAEFDQGTADVASDEPIVEFVSEFLDGILDGGHLPELALSHLAGPYDDTVIALCVPYDRYAYRVLQHTDAAMIGRVVTLDLPRAPIPLAVGRATYNQSLFPGALRVDEQVFQHQVGDPWSYASAAHKEAVLATRGGLQQHIGSVSSGMAPTSGSLSVGDAVGPAGELELLTTQDLATTGGGVLHGFRVGSSEFANVSTFSPAGAQTTCTLGALPAAEFDAYQYELGIWSYPYLEGASGRGFQVVDYWVE